MKETQLLTNIPFNSKSLPPEQRSSQNPTKQVSSISTTENGNRPPLPLTVPIQWNRHSAQPRAHKATHQTAKGLIERCTESADRSPGGRVDAVYVEEREECKEGKVRGAQECMRPMCGEGRAEEDHGEV